MKVALAAQVLSDSVAAALRICQKLNLSGFDEASGTATFIEVITNQYTTNNKLFYFACLFVVILLCINQMKNSSYHWPKS